ELERLAALIISPAGAVREQHFGVDAVAVERARPRRRIVDLARHLFPSLRIIAALRHRGRAVAHVAALDLAVDDPALDGKSIFFLARLDNARDAVAPLRARHAVRKRVFIELSVGVGADEAVAEFHVIYPEC